VDALPRVYYFYLWFDRFDRTTSRVSLLDVGGTFLDGIGHDLISN
jgi:hypothetical protein